ncbi:polycomb protein esc-like [Teleopsis dalmanni]|uniref:polycomb protein esc-like n=1 Tax=Teleopsis dalmanni TaxID=139649 RepID=UPI0018CFE788|nr:polycomb protein esc-like [Teleopsis dalmanni]
MSMQRLCAKKNSRFPTWREHFPDFSTRDVHRNYVDCVQWFGNFLLSKSCENEIVCWKRGDLDDTVLKPNDTTATVLHRFPIKDCDIWFIRFEFNFSHKMMALGNQQGVTYVWEMGVEDPQSTKCHMLAHARCNTAIRQTTFSRNGNVLICVCDDGTIWRWDRRND